MQLLAVVPSIYNTSPGQRYRIEQWEPILTKFGVEITYAPFESQELNEVLYRSGNYSRKIGLLLRSISRRIELMSTLKKYDAIYIFREAALLGPAFFERLVHRSKVPFVFDFDDAIFERYKSPSNGYLSYLKMPGKTSAICRMAAHVIVGNPYLEQYARKFNDRVTIVPPTIDTESYFVSEIDRDSSVPVIGWTGSFSTVQHLDTLRGALQRLALERKFILRVIGTPSYKIPNVEVEAITWRAASEVDDLRPIDIGIMPLPDDSWTKGKCGMKALQFMGLGLPTVCSPVGVNTEIIRDGENGFLAATEADWVDKLGRLLDSVELRKKLGAAARATVEQKYSAKVQAPRVFDVFRSVLRESTVNAAAVSPRSATRVQNTGI